MLDFPVLSVGIDAVGPEGLDRPSTGVRTAVEAKFDKDGKFDKEGKRCADAQPRHAQHSPHTTTLSTHVQVRGRVCSTNCVTTSSCTREQPRRSVHLIRHLASRLRRRGPLRSLTESWVERAKGGVAANASPLRLLALGAVCSIERKEGRFNTHSALHGLVDSTAAGGVRV